MEALDIPLTPAVASVAVVLLTIVYYLIKNRGVLPGPIGVPYFGLYPFLTNENAHLKLDEYKRKYGDIFSFTCTGRLFINLGTVKAMRELHAIQSDCFLDKFQESHVSLEMMRNGVAFVNGEPWKILRRYFILRFREYGLYTGRESMAGPVYDSLNATLEDLKSQRQKPVDIFQLLAKRCTVAMRKIIFEEDGVTDEELGRMLDAYSGSLDGNTGVNLLLIGPFARLLFHIKPSLRKCLKQQRIMSKFLLDCAKKTQASMDDEQHPTCIVQDFYKERNERRRKNDPTWKYFTDEALLDSTLQFVGDGILGVAIAITGCLNALLEYPDEQEKLYAELMEVVGPNRQPVAEDRSHMPYTNAFLNEYLRKTNFAHFIPSLECTKETAVRGYRIPKGSITLLNFWSAHNDPETFEDPDKFDPSRYLPSPGKSKAELPVTFGMGKRSCAGESFLMLQSFLFLTTIVKNFKVVSSNAPTDKSADFLMTGQLELTFEPRDEN